MTLGRVVGICACVVISSDAVAGQQSTTVIERTHAAGGLAPWRRVQVRTESGSRAIVVDTFEMPDVEGRLAPTQQSVEETNRPSPNTAHTRRELFWFAPDGRRTLTEATDSLQEPLANGGSRVVHETSVPDLNGRLTVTSRQIDETRFDPGRVRYDSTQLVRDLNGRWLPIEVHRGDTRILAAERLEEATIQRHDVNGTLAVVERRDTRSSSANGRDRVVIEIQTPYADGSSPWALSERVHLTTTATADGGRHTIEEVESRNRANPSDPLRVIRRTVTTVRRAGSGRWVTERQVFELDVNGRFVLVDTEEEDRQD